MLLVTSWLDVAIGEWQLSVVALLHCSCIVLASLASWLHRSYISNWRVPISSGPVASFAFASLACQQLASSCGILSCYLCCCSCIVGVSLSLHHTLFATASLCHSMLQCCFLLGLLQPLAIGECPLVVA